MKGEVVTVKKCNQDRWDILLTKIKDEERREQFDKFVEFLKEKTSYFTAPASPKYHCSWEEGLLEHSLNVAENALVLNKALKAGLNEEELVICGLFHDLGKAYIGDNEPYYTVAVPTENQAKWGYVPFPPYNYNQNGQVWLSVPQRSVRLVTQYINISDAAYQAILIHDGQYVPENSFYSSHECPMALILNYADNWAGFTMEGQVAKSDDGKSYLYVDVDKVGKNGYEKRESMIKED